MALDPYELCPCGSGKKSKFCCLDIAADMEKVGRLKSNNQLRQAMQAVEKVAQKHPGRPWVVTTHAALLNDEHRFEEAREELKKLLKAEPTHPLGNALYAMTSFNIDGWPASKSILHRAFKACVKARPDAVFSLARAVSQEMLDTEHVMGGRQHLALAMRHAPPDARQQVFAELMEVDGDVQAFYPLRGPHSLNTGSAPDNVRPAFEKAIKLAAVGCYETAADGLQELVDGDWKDAPTGVLADIALLRAWDGEEKAAAKALREAAAKTDDRDEAAEWLALAALLDIEVAEDSSPLMARLFSCEDLGKVRDALAAGDRLVDTQTDSEDRPGTALFLVLDRDEPDAYGDETQLSEVASIIGRVTLSDFPEGQSEDAEGRRRANVTVFAVDNGELEKSVAAVNAAVGDALTELTDRTDEERTLGRVAAEIEAVRWEPYLPPKTPASARRRLFKERWENVFDEVWPETPSVALGGKKPSEAGDDQTAMMAALQVLDAVCDTHRVRAPLEDLRERYEIPEAAPLDVTDDLPLGTLSISQLTRVPMDQLNDDQARIFVQRVVLTGHSRFMGEVLEAALDRGLDLTGVIERPKAYLMLADLRAQAMDTAGALEWVDRASADLVDESTPQGYEERIKWKMAELGYRLDEPHADETKALLIEMHDVYGAKVPELREHLDGIVEELGIDKPWSGIILPGGEGASQAGEKKLILPT